MWLSVAVVVLALVALDAAVRALLLLRLGRKIDQKGDYRKREHQVGKGNKHFVITLLGASSIYGEGSRVEMPFAGNLAKRLAKQDYRVSVHNLAVSGHKVADVTRQQIPRMEPSNLVLVYAGTKDCLTLTPTKQYLANTHKLAKALQGQTVIWVTIGDPRLLWLFPICLRWLFYVRAQTFTKLLKQVVAEHPAEQWRVVDFFTEGIAEAKRRGMTVRQIVSDGIHLSDAGQHMISDMISDTANLASL